MASKTLGFVVGLASVSALSSMALAQAAGSTCTTDDDCGVGTWCTLSHNSDPDEPPSVDPVPEPDVNPTRGATAALDEARPGTCDPIPEGACESDTDCDDGFECIRGQWSSGCAAPVDGEADCETTSGVERYGSCELKPIECFADSDCPNGLSCAAVTDVGDEPCSSDAPDCAGGSDGSSGSGTSSSAGTKAATKYCTYVPKACESDTDCDANYECAISEVKACSGGGREPGIACDSATGDCFASTPAPEEQCTTEYTEGFCLPKLIPCTGTSECPNDYVCYEVEAELVPESWDASGDTKSCVPEGIALFAQVSGRDLGTVGDGASQGDDDKGESSNEDDPQQGAGLGGLGKKGDGSACSVSSTQSGSSLLLGVFSVLGLCLIRRRRGQRVA